MGYRIVIAIAAALALGLILTQRISRRDAAVGGPGATAEVASDREGAQPPALQASRSSRSAASAVSESAEMASSPHWLESLFTPNGELPPLPQEAIDRWLASGRTNAEGLLALRQAGAGKEFFFTALTNFPNDPRVLFAATALSDGPEAQRERLNRFQATVPDNALADYLSARDHLKNNRPEQGLADLAAASTKPHFNDYVLDAIQNTEELYLQAGRSPAEAKALAASTALMPHLVQLKGLAQDIAALQGQYQAAGDPDSVSRLAQLGLQLGERLASGEGSTALIGQLVGIAVEQIVLRQLEPDRNYEFLQGSVNDYISQLKARKAASRENSQFFEQWMRNASEAEIISYFDRFKLYGELEAMKWMRQRSTGP